ncbi:SDR family NAD(P)-dependent oxidoreductase [Neorhizobium galegae]|uniref:SDR family NAD(P)-dependent oxidoreductase n=1 Tax=Neorhizobium galegae TaxID=399 RepID=UPI0006226F13|nr:SDR family NAD(P)-dependent oxidoreductase [Neorhizobium galegae]CDZ29736.1 Short chain dehydrogenase [Neorhizobium galegae bv. officinalis]KAA9385103.1 SDR family oxidoreductase [Neorhizobium galegae]KAB1110558.1 SDR family oxidoreductase [Neorhizobium galegae]MCM2501402.1 SDR family oxidoreductase [Neorhizobium galegae]MCQ1768951.1 SDR family oxidoreductase [Neorhizobium galegae]
MRSVVVTGAGSGIGLSTTELLIEAGWHVLAADRDAEALERLMERLGNRAGLLTAVLLDITDEKAIADFAERCQALHSPLQALVNSAGIGSNVRFAETTTDQLRRMYEVNVVGAFALSQALAPIMRENGGGSIVHIASVSGIKGNLGRSAYGASKGALVTLTKIMAVELADDLIRVNAIAPGPIETPMVKETHTAVTREEWNRTVPMRRYGRPEEIATAIAFLVDERQSSYVTGQILAVDGGFTAAGLMA